MEGWLNIGGWLAAGYELYATGLLAGCLGGHYLALALYLYSERRPPLSQVGRLIEVLYGFVHPLLYLLVFQQSFFGAWTPWPLTLLQWSAFLAYWIRRGMGAVTPADLRQRQWAARLALGVIGITAIRDLGVAAFTRPFPEELVIGLFLFPLYFIPLATAEQNANSPRPELWLRGPPSPWRRLVALCALFLAGVLGVGLLWRPSEDSARLQVAAHRDHIQSAAREANLDPKLLASILYVTHRNHTTQVGQALESVAAGLWRSDEKSHSELATAFDPSLGLLQIKPVTAMTAITIRWNAQPRRSLWIPSKSYREVPLAGDAYKRLALAPLGALPGPPQPAGKGQVVASLLDDQETFRWAAFILNIYATHWEATDPGWSIRQRPEILATLYQLGFNHSHPKPAPQANDFGRAVLAAHQSAWMRELFD